MAPDDAAGATVTPLRLQPANAAPAAPKYRDESVPEMPDWLSPAGRRLFRTIVTQAEVAAPGWLKSVDSLQVAFAAEHAAVAIAALREMRGPGGRYDGRLVIVDDGHQGRTAKNPAAQVFRDNAKAFLELLTALGLPARERAKLKLADLADDDDDEAGVWS